MDRLSASLGCEHLSRRGEVHALNLDGGAFYMVVEPNEFMVWNQIST